MEQNRTDPRSIPDALLEGWRAAGEAAAGYSLVAYDVPVPERRRWPRTSSTRAT